MRNLKAVLKMIEAKERTLEAAEKTKGQQAYKLMTDEELRFLCNLGDRYGDDFVPSDLSQEERAEYERIESRLRQLLGEGKNAAII
jgi:hypothetical protein